MNNEGEGQTKKDRIQQKTKQKKTERNILKLKRQNINTTAAQRFFR